MKALRPLCLEGLPGSPSLGQMSTERWEALAANLIEADALKVGAVDPRQAFMDRFLPAAESHRH